MGSCVSLHKHDGSSDSAAAAVKLRLSDHHDVSMNNDQRNLLIPPSPVKHNPDAVDGLFPAAAAAADVALRPRRSSSRFPPGSKEEAFFDSQPWLDSDCEDDFLSVNGDFSPSRGSTPVHHKFSSGDQQQLAKAAPGDVEGTNGSLPEPPASPGDKKRRLSELFQESLRREQPVDDIVVPENPVPQAVNGRGNSNGTERTSNGVVDEDGKTGKSPQCCLPRLVPSRSYSERKKKMSPARSLG